MKRNLAKRLCCLGLSLAVLFSINATVLAADKSIGGGALKISGILSESTAQYVIPADPYLGTPEKTITVPLYKLDKSSKLVYDATVTPDDLCWLDISCKLEGDKLVYDEDIHCGDDTPIRCVGEGEIPKVSTTGLAYTIDKISTYSFHADGYYLLRYDPTPMRFQDGSGGGIDLSEKAEYIILQVGGASVPVAPVQPATPDLSATVNQSPVLIDGVETPFQAYTISGNNYFKLRDVASVLSGSKRQFEVTWDSARGAIQIVTGQPYTAVGGEMERSEGTQAKTCVLNKAPVYLDGKSVELTAYTIDGNNYFKLRDLGAAIGFNVSWDGASGSIVVDTSQAYTAD